VSIKIFYLLKGLGIKIIYKCVRGKRNMVKKREFCGEERREPLGRIGRGSSFTKEKRIHLINKLPFDKKMKGN